MGDTQKKRWSVTYTKHLTQKRKVYHDGYLELYTSTNKIKLYDDCQTLLGVKIVKKGDVISSGESLAFDAYLVDIGDLEGGSKPAPSTYGQVRDTNMTRKTRLFRNAKKFKSPIASDRTSSLGKNQVPSSSLSPSRKIIREFKKNEMNKYAGPIKSPDATKSSSIEWQVLYTTQITQKAKKYHDGILKLVACGSLGRQVTLYDLNSRVLESRFLKKDEEIESGRSLFFDGHLVDIGEREGDHKPIPNLKAQERVCSARSKTELSGRQLAEDSHCFDKENHACEDNKPQVNNLTAAESTTREWHALYTNQITQKAKKYQSGILKVASSGSYQLQATLVNEDGFVLSRKFLKLSEDVRSGSSFQLSNYLVEVGEPREIPEEPLNGKDVESASLPTINIFKPGKDDPVGEPPSKILFERDVKSTFHARVDKSEPGKNDPLDKRLRGANDILSILRKSTTPQSSVPTKSTSSEQCYGSQSTDSLSLKFQNHVNEQVGGSLCDKHGAKSHKVGLVRSEVSDSTLLSLSTREEVLYDIPSLNIDGESKPDSSALEPQHKLELQVPLPLDEGSTGITMSFKDETSCLNDVLSKKLDSRTITQLDEEDKMGTERPSFKVCSNEMDEIPSFDLGF